MARTGSGSGGRPVTTQPVCANRAGGHRDSAAVPVAEPRTLPRLPEPGPPGTASRPALVPPHMGTATRPAQQHRHRPHPGETPLLPPDSIPLAPSHPCSPLCPPAAPSPVTCGQQLAQAGVGHGQLRWHQGARQPLRLGATSLCLWPPTLVRGWCLGGGTPGVPQQGGGQELRGSRAGVSQGHHARGIAQRWGVGGEAGCREGAGGVGEQRGARRAGEGQLGAGGGGGGEEGV